jgi:CHAT domain-containing protein
MWSSFLRQTAFLIVCASFVDAQQPDPKELLAHAVRLADLYNWDDAGPAFAEAERLFVDAGDRRNALYAKLGRIRSNSDGDQQTLPAMTAQLAEALEDDPLLQNDKELRMFCFIVKGDIDTETNTGAMRQDWVQVQTLAQELGNAKWQYRALAQLGIAAFYDADLETARKDAGIALAAATKAGDIGAQIRILTILASGLFESKMYEQALAVVDNALKIATATPGTGSQFGTQELRIDVLIGLGQLDTAQRTVLELLTRAREAHKAAHVATLYGLAANIAEARNDHEAAVEALHQVMTLGESAGLTRLLAGVYGQAAEFYRVGGDLENAERFADLSSAATQASGDLWAVPQHLQTLAELQIARGRYQEADRTYDRAEAFLDSLIGNASTLLEQTAVITASSQIYSQHFALISDRFNNPQKAYTIIEQVRGRAAADLLASRMTTPSAAKTIERAVSRLRLKLMAAQSTHDVASLRDEIFMEEQARWVTPGASVLQANSRETVAVEQLEKRLPASTVLLEYVMADPNSYCLVISASGSRIVHLGSKARIDALVGSYLKSVKAKLPAIREARSLYDVLVRPIRETTQQETLIIVPDGQLHLVPFDALRDPSGRYVVETRTVIYSPSASSFYLLREQKRPQAGRKSLLAVGGVPYAGSSLNRSVLTRGFNRSGFVDLPSSADEVRIAQAAFPNGKVDLLVGPSATEAAFKAASLNEYRIIHLAVHGFADSTFPDRAALVLLSDPSVGEDGFLQASEIAQLRFDADLVVLSACETAVGPLQGQDGTANLTRAFLMAGARTVISTLWQIDDSSSLFLMKRFYAHLSTNQSAASALTAAKRDVLRTFGPKALPYQWAAFTIEGAGGLPTSSRSVRDN